MPALRMLVAAVTALWATLVAGPALAEGNYPPAPVRVVAGVVSADRAPVGDSVTFSGGGFAPGALLRMSVDGAESGTTNAAADGTFSVPVSLSNPGERVLGASGLEPGGRVRVVSAAVIADATPLAAVSSSSDLGLGLVVGLLVVLLSVTGLFAVRARGSRRVAVPVPH